MIPFPITLSGPIFQGHGFTIDALDVLCAQLTRDLFAIAKFMLYIKSHISRCLNLPSSFSSRFADASLPCVFGCSQHHRHIGQTDVNPSTGSNKQVNVASASQSSSCNRSNANNNVS